MMSLVIKVILLAIINAELWLKPRIDKTSENDLILWYGRTKRKYYKICKL